MGTVPITRQRSPRLNAQSQYTTTVGK